MTYGDYPVMDPYYERELENYNDEIDMCNQLGLNLDEIYDYGDSDDDDE